MGSPPTDYDVLHVEPLTPQLGATVRGVQISAADDGVIDAIHAAWMDWKVLFFRDQHLSIEEHIEFGRRFGEPERHPFLADPEYPELFVLDSAGNAPYKANFWHTDVTFQQAPPMGSILKGAIVPTVGGDTAWADMERAYDELSDDVKAQIDGRTATHTLSRTFGTIMTDEERARRLAEHPDQHHPIVRAHPVTGRPSLFVNSPFVSHIDDMEPDEGKRLLRHLLASVNRLELQARFRWEPNSIAMWDNRNTQHYGVVDYEGRRRMERVTLLGDRPIMHEGAR